jgi:hypothetical protein
MRYMMLIYTKEASLEALPPEEQQQIRDAHAAMIAETRKRGVLLAVNPLAATTAATTVRSDGGKVMVTDGPFAETREQLAGYYILECKDLDEAIAWAAKIPTKCGGQQGSIEIRPIQAIPGVPESHLGSEPLSPGRTSANSGGAA